MDCVGSSSQLRSGLQVPEMNSTHACDKYYSTGECRFEDTPFMQDACSSLSGFMMLLQTTMMARCDIADPCRRFETHEIEEYETFDFIIVGAGVAGPVIARRLADHVPFWKVLLIEAGPPEPSMTAFPGFAFNAINTSLDWSYKTEPTQPHPTACLETNGICTWPRGKMVSGSGGMYGMMYVRGHPEVFNRWARAGNDGWSYDEIEHYFERAEDVEVPGMTSGSDRPPTGERGPLKIKYYDHRPAFTEEVLKAAAELGYKTSRLAGEDSTGFMIAPMIIEDGIRGTTSRLYLRPIAHRPNLKILTHAYVTRIVRHNWEGAARGVELIDRNGVRKVIRADKEIILTAGAIGSPQILLNSGIGPKEDLDELGIPVWQDLPVGRNLHNHVSFGIKMTINDTHYEDITVEAVEKFLHNRTGPLSSTGLTQVTAFLESSYTTPGVPDIQVFFDGFSSKCPMHGVKGECPGGTFGSCPTRRELVARPTTAIVKTRGVLKLRSKNPLDRPLLYPNYLTDEQDLMVLMEGIRKVEELIDTPTMKKWDLRFEETNAGACSRYHFGTDAYWECMIRTQTGPENHQAGTCKMGPAIDPTAVVDPELRVHGIPNIRVADASIYPEVPNANPTASIVMIAEKAADMIGNTWFGI
ncbi:glucose dehydrogenase [FAD, quinone] [Diachasma alloeum]|uniref:glucose dehydrogenase [FAD, quinone] n=1 Tax=Diachasma alloeum TaxID=454923 RepID=UPI000738108E|nr:glucose dehydrogenase [FAD, quinone] [Diachasma alloeum]